MSGSSATSNVRDVTDVSPMEEGRKKKEEGKYSQSNIFSAQKCPNLLASSYKLRERSH